MIKLIDILKEGAEDSEAPYMYSPVGFSCAVCKYMNHNKEEDTYTCSSQHYQDYMGTHYLVDENKQPLTKDMLSKYCSNWFEPKIKQKP